MYQFILPGTGMRPNIPRRARYFLIATTLPLLVVFQTAFAQDPIAAAGQVITNPIDASFSTAYTFSTDLTTVNWDTSGTTRDGGDGSYGDGTLGPFGKIGALIEGLPYENAKTRTVRRAI